MARFIGFQRLSMAMFLAASAFMGSLAVAQERSGPSGSGGGDRCENRFKIVADDLKSWLVNDGGKNLKLVGISPEEYKERMLAAMAGYRVTCVGPLNVNEGFPVLVNGKPKECRADGIDRRVTCEIGKFYTGFDPDDNPTQYKLVHHEFATIAGLERADADDSEYHVSNQIEGFLEAKFERRLAVKPLRVRATRTVKIVGYEKWIPGWNGQPERYLAPLPNGTTGKISLECKYSGLPENRRHFLRIGLYEGVGSYFREIWINRIGGRTVDYRSQFDVAMKSEEACHELRFALQESTPENPAKMTYDPVAGMSDSSQLFRFTR